jgi:multicomponent Na+:H+ antiporter subunit B
MAAFAVLLIYAVSDLPQRGNPDNQMNQKTSMINTPVPAYYYIKHAYHDAHAPNIVTVVLGDYRGIDTFGEQIVIFTAGMITILLLRRSKRRVS